MSLPQKTFRPGDRLAADDFQEIWDELIRLGKIVGVPPLNVDAGAAGGPVIELDDTPAVWIKLTSGGTGGKYAWTLQIEQAGGTWANDPGGASGTTSTDPAYEFNLLTTVSLSPNPVVRAWRDANGLLRFQARC